MGIAVCLRVCAHRRTCWLGCGVCILQIGGVGAEWLSSSGVTCVVDAHTASGAVVAGEFRSPSIVIAEPGPAQRTATTLTNRGNSDVFVARFDLSHGDLIWALTMGGPGDEAVFAVAAAPKDGLFGRDAVWVAGSFTSEHMILQVGSGLAAVPTQAQTHQTPHLSHTPSRAWRSLRCT